MFPFNHEGENAERGAFGVFFLWLCSSCAAQHPALNVPNLMRLDLRKAGAWFAIVSLIFWCSCERHHVGELAGHSEGDPPHQHETKSDQPASTTNASHTAQTPAPRNSPANFFPDKPKP